MARRNLNRETSQPFFEALETRILMSGDPVSFEPSAETRFESKISAMVAEEMPTSTSAFESKLTFQLKGDAKTQSASIHQEQLNNKYSENMQHDASSAAGSDMDQDGIDDIGLWVPTRADQ